MGVTNDGHDEAPGRRIVVHIGAEKTATTSIQAAAMVGHGTDWYAPHDELGGPNMPLLAFAFGTIERLPDVARVVRREFGAISQGTARRRVAAAVSSSGSLPVLLSCEYLYSRLESAQWADMLAELRRLGTTVEFVCVLRDIRPVVSGLVTEALKSGNPARVPADVFTGPYGFGRGGYFGVAHKVASLRELCGDQLRLYRYEDLASDGDVVGSLFDDLDFALPPDSETHVENTRISTSQAAALRGLNRLTPRSRRSLALSRLARRSLLELPGNGAPFDPLASSAPFRSPSFHAQIAEAQAELDALVPRRRKRDLAG